MDLQNVRVSGDAPRKTPELFFRMSGAPTFDDGRLVVKSGEKCAFDTVNGAFAIGQWRKRCVLDNLALTVNAHGRFALTAKHRKSADNELGFVDETALEEREFVEHARVDLPMRDEGLLFFELTALEDGLFCDARYSTDAKGARDARIFNIVATANDPDCARANMARLTSGIIANPISPLFGWLKVFVADNSGALAERVGDISVAANGAGASRADAVARGMLEFLADPDRARYSRILTCDWDVPIEPETYLRLSAFCALLKKECAGLAIGGPALDSANMREIVECGMTRSPESGRIEPALRGADLADPAGLLRAAGPDADGENAFCSFRLCCLPPSAAQADDLPLPLSDDACEAEYMTRRKFRRATLVSAYVPALSPGAPTAERARDEFRDMCAVECARDEARDARAIAERLKARVRECADSAPDAANGYMSGAEEFLAGASGPARIERAGRASAGQVRRRLKKVCRRLEAEFGLSDWRYASKLAMLTGAEHWAARLGAKKRGE